MRAPLTLTLLLAAALAALAAPAGAQEILEELPSVTLPPWFL